MEELYGELIDELALALQEDIGHDDGGKYAALDELLPKTGVAIFRLMLARKIGKALQ